MQTGRYQLGKHLKPGRLFWLPATACLFLALAWPSVTLAMVKPVPQSSWFIQMDQYAGGAHGTLSCRECHPAMTANGRPHPDKEADNFLKKDSVRSYDYKTCNNCHKTAHDRVLKGAHAEALEKQNKEGKPSETGYAPNCGDCHSAHYAKSHESRITVGKAMMQSCGSCHPDQAASYLANYHGKAAVNLASEKAAFCTDCHGAHTTVSLKDETVILNTCKRCHPDATKEFANIIIHDSTKDLDKKSDSKFSGLKMVHWLGSLSLIFVTVLLVLFYTHTGLLMLRKLHEKLRGHK